eukprot:6665299-Pyramimonas_sp.AAC.1
MPSRRPRSPSLGHLGRIGALVWRPGAISRPPEESFQYFRERMTPPGESGESGESRESGNLAGPPQKNRPDRAPGGVILICAHSQEATMWPKSLQRQ